MSETNNPKAVLPPEAEERSNNFVLEVGNPPPVEYRYIEEDDVYEIVNGTHRYITMRNNKKIRDLAPHPLDDLLREL